MESPFQSSLSRNRVAQRSTLPAQERPQPPFDNSTSTVISSTGQVTSSSSIFQGASDNGSPSDDGPVERGSVYSLQESAPSSDSSVPADKYGAPRDNSIILVQGLFPIAIILMLLSSTTYTLSSSLYNPSLTSPETGRIPSGRPLSAGALFVSLALQSLATAFDIVASTLMDNPPDIESRNRSQRRLGIALGVLGRWLMAGVPVAFVVGVGLCAAELQTVTPELIKAFSSWSSGTNDSLK